MTKVFRRAIIAYDIKAEIIKRLESIPGLESRASKVAGGSAIFYNNKLSAHKKYICTCDTISILALLIGFFIGLRLRITATHY